MQLVSSEFNTYLLKLFNRVCRLVRCVLSPVTCLCPMVSRDVRRPFVALPGAKTWYGPHRERKEGSKKLKNKEKIGEAAWLVTSQFGSLFDG